MTLFALIYLISSFISVAAGLPQIKRLLALKRADEFSPSTWFGWATTQTISLVYVISIGNFPLIVVNTLWVMYHSFCTCLILYYRKYPGGEATPEYVPEEANDPVNS